LDLEVLAQWFRAGRKIQRSWI